MFFTRKRTILICAIIFVYGATIVVDFFWHTQPTISPQTVAAKESVIEKQREISTNENTIVQVADKSTSNSKANSTKKNVAFDITQDNEKVFLAFADETEKKEIIAHTTEQDVAKEVTDKQETAKKEIVQAKEEVVKKEQVQEDIAKKEVMQQAKADTFHIVALGDNLWKISKKYYKKTNYQDIQRGVFALAGANPHIRDIDRLNINTQLFVPLASKINLYYKKYLYQIQISRQMMSSKKITKTE